MIYPHVWKFLKTTDPYRLSLVGIRPGTFHSNTHAKLTAAAREIQEGRANQEQPAKIDAIVKQTGVTGLPELCRLPYWDWHKNTLLEPMHILFNQGNSSASLAVCGCSISMRGLNTQSGRQQTSANSVECQVRFLPSNEILVYTMEAKPPIKPNWLALAWVKALKYNTRFRRDATNSFSNMIDGQ